MRAQNPVESLAAALHHAALVALPDLCYDSRDFAAERARDDERRRGGLEVIRRDDSRFEQLMRPTVRRPTASECRVVAMFPQTWSSTALGFGGLGGQAFTEAYTAVIEGPDGTQAVYWSGQFAYSVPPTGATEEQREAWRADLQARRTTDRRDAPARYGAQPGEASSLA